MNASKLFNRVHFIGIGSYKYIQRHATSTMLDKSLSLRVCYLTSKNMHEHNLPLIFLNISLNINVIKLEVRSSSSKTEQLTLLEEFYFGSKQAAPSFQKRGGADSIFITWSEAANTFRRLE